MKNITAFALLIATAALTFVATGCEPEAPYPLDGGVHRRGEQTCSPSADNCPQPEPPCVPNPSAGKECPPKTVAPTACPQQMPPAVTGQPCCLPAWPEALWGTWQPVMQNGVPFECVVVVAP